MAQFLGFGNGKDGFKKVTGTEDLNIRTYCSGSASSKTLTVGSTSGFSAGDIILIHKTRGNTTTTCGTWELNQIESVGAGSFTLVMPLENSYQYENTGSRTDNKSQCVRVPQYTGVTVESSGIATPADWNGTTGGILAFCCSGVTTVTGKIHVNKKGFRGGYAATDPGDSGEGTEGAPASNTINANGNGGGGGPFGGGGAGGGNATSGGQPGAGVNDAVPGSAAGSADLTTMVFGGAGGSGTGDGDKHLGGKGGDGGGIIVIFSRVVTGTGYIQADGENGANGQSGGGGTGGGGGGAGGSILIKGQTLDMSSFSGITANAGQGGLEGEPSGGGGGGGSYGRIRREGCTITGSTTPTASDQEGGLSWCGSVAAILA